MREEDATYMLIVTTIGYEWSNLYLRSNYKVPPCSGPHGVRTIIGSLVYSDSSSRNEVTIL